MDIGQLTIKMGADIAQLRADMDKAKTTVTSTMAAIEGAAKVAGAAIGAIGLGLSARAMFEFVQKAVDARAALHDLAIQTGASEAALAKFKAIGAFSETQIESITGAMGKLAKGMSAADEETKGAGVAVQALGLNLAAFKRESPEQQLLDAANALDQFRDGANKSALAQALFGREGAKLLPFLKDLADGTAEVTAATTADQVERQRVLAAMSDAFGDNLLAARKQSESWKRDLVAGLTPALYEFSQAFLDTTTSAGGLKDQIARLSKDGTFAEWAREAITLSTYVVDDLQIIARLGEQIGDSFSTVGSKLKALVGGQMTAAGLLVTGHLSAANDAVVKSLAAIDAAEAAYVQRYNDRWSKALMGGQMRDRMAALKGTMPDAGPTKPDAPDIAGQLARLKGTTGAGADDGLSEYEKLIRKIQEKIAIQRTEAAVGRSLSEVERMRAEILQQEATGQLVLTASQHAAVAAVLDLAQQQETANAALKKEADLREQIDKAAQHSADTVAARVQELQDEEAAAQLAGTANISLASAIEQVRIARLLDARSRAMLSGDQAQVQAIDREIAARKELARLQDAKDQRASAAKAAEEAARSVESYLQSGGGTDFAAGFDKASQSLGVFAQQLAKLSAIQDAYDKARADAGKNGALLAEVESHHLLEQASTYASLAGAAKGFFKENTAGYKILSASEKAFRAWEIALAIKNAAQKIGLIEGVTAAKVAGDTAQSDSFIASAAKQIAAFFGIGQASAAAGVANQAQGDPYTAFARMAAMAAIMAALGFETGAFGGGGDSTIGTVNNGTGTVLGDSNAVSESIKKSIDLLKDVDTETMRYSAQMLAALQSIDSSISGVATLLIQSGGVDAASANVQLGVTTSSLHSLEASATRAALAYYTLGASEALGLGASLERFLNRTMGTVKSISGQGIYGAPQDLGSVLANGYQASYYADIQSKKKFVGITTSTSNSTVLTPADAELERQFSLILSGFADTVEAAAGPLGVSLSDVEAKLNGFVVDIGKINLQGLTGTQINEKLTAVFGAEGDKIAKAALGGLEDFQKVGEGYLETVVRVASGTEEATALLKRLGLSVVSLNDLLNKQGDVSAELVRQSILVVESTSSGVAEVISNLNGTGEEIATAYKSLTDLRRSLELFGLSGQAVGYSLLQGAGGLQALSDAVSSYEKNFLSSSAQVSNQAARLKDQFAQLGLAMPTSKDGFVALVNGIDTSTAAGQELLGSVLGLSSGFSDLLDAVKSVGSGIEDEINRIRGLWASSNSASSYAALQAKFAVTTAQARAGDQTALDALPQLSQQLLSMAENQATSRLELIRMQAQVAASLQATLAAARATGIPGFASGTNYFAGGLAMVGEQGPELVALGESRVWNADKTSAILAGANSSAGDSSDVVAELRGLRDENAALRQELTTLREDVSSGLAAVAMHTNRSARILERVAPEGDAIETRIVT